MKKAKPSVPAMSTGLSGQWYVSPSGACRTDVGVVPGSCIETPAEDTWRQVRDMLTTQVESPGPLQPSRRWRSHRKVCAGPVRLSPWSVLVDADCAAYRAPMWLCDVVGGIDEPQVVVLPAEDQPSGLAVALVSDSTGPVSLCALVRLQC